MKTFVFEPDDSLTVSEPGTGGETRYSMTPEQAALHDRDPAWRAAMTPAQRTRADQIKQRLADEQAARDAAAAAAAAAAEALARRGRK